MSMPSQEQQPPWKKPWNVSDLRFSSVYNNNLNDNGCLMPIMLSINNKSGLLTLNVMPMTNMKDTTCNFDDGYYRRELDPSNPDHNELLKKFQDIDALMVSDNIRHKILPNSSSANCHRVFTTKYIPIVEVETVEGKPTRYFFKTMLKKKWGTWGADAIEIGNKSKPKFEAASYIFSKYKSFKDFVSISYVNREVSGDEITYHVSIRTAFIRYISNYSLTDEIIPFTEFDETRLAVTPVKLLMDERNIVIHAVNLRAALLMKNRNVITIPKIDKDSFSSTNAKCAFHKRILDANVPADLQEIEKWRSIDNYLGSEQFKQSTFSGNISKYQYMPLLIRYSSPSKRDYFRDNEEENNLYQVRMYFKKEEYDKDISPSKFTEDNPQILTKFSKIVDDNKTVSLQVETVDDIRKVLSTIDKSYDEKISIASIREHKNADKYGKFPYYAIIHVEEMFLGHRDPDEIGSSSVKEISK